MKTESGSASIAVVAVVAATTAMGILVMVIGAILTVVVKTQTAADLAAISAAQSAPSALLFGSDSVCEISVAVAQANAAVVRDCWVADGDVRVVVEGTMRFAGWDVPVVSRARAGLLERPQSYVETRSPADR